jgi:hypothetical protein
MGSPPALPHGAGSPSEQMELQLLPVPETHKQLDPASHEGLPVAPLIRNTHVAPDLHSIPLQSPPSQSMVVAVPDAATRTSPQSPPSEQSK